MHVLRGGSSLLVTLFVGPQIVGVADALWWAGGFVVLGVGTWFADALSSHRLAPLATAVVAAAGLGLVLAGTRP